MLRLPLYKSGDEGVLARPPARSPLLPLCLRKVNYLALLRFPIRSQLSFHTPHSSQTYQSSMHPMSRSQFYDLSPFRYCKPELVQRISSWRMDIQHTTDSNGPSGSASNATRARSRQQKPYTRPEQRSSTRNSCSSDIYVSDGLERPPHHPVEIPLHPVVGDAISSVQVHYIVKPRRSNDLPDPERNPLVTNSQTDLEEEYTRVARLYKNLEEKKGQLEHFHLRQPSDTIIQQLMDVGASLQRLVNSAHYIISYSESLRLNIDFAALLREQQQRPIPRHEPSELTIKMPQPRAFNEGWKVNPL